MKKGFFISGTDTGVGKTIAASVIAVGLKKKGWSVGFMKPVQTGALLEGENRFSPDLEFSQRALGLPYPENHSTFSYHPQVPYLLKEPLAPYVAAKLEEVEIQPSRLLDSAKWLAQHYDFLIIEGAGGVLVPITQDYLMIDLIKDLGYPVVLVGRTRLGTINHTLLTLEALRNRSIPIAGLVFNNPEPEIGDICEQTNPEVIEAFGQVPILGIFPHLSDMASQEEGGARRAIEALAFDHLKLPQLSQVSDDGCLCQEQKQRSAELKAWDKKYLWHPFTQMQSWVKDDPLVIEEGRGVYLIDSDGQEYIDGVASLWTNVHGHRKQAIDQAINRQLSKIAHSTFLGLTHAPAIILAKRLIELAPEGLSRVFYSDNGATACEIALKMSYQYWQQQGRSEKKGFIYFENSYHGDTLGAVSVGGLELFHSLYRPLLFQAHRVASPYCYRCPWALSPVSCHFRCLDDLERVLSAKAAEICALIIESCVQGAGGILVEPPGFLAKVRELCSRYEILMIADEVAVGFGRTGQMFACQHEQVSPDLLCLAKGLTAGYLPMAATLTTEAIYKGFLGDYSQMKTFFHGHTYTGNPLACSAALANLEIFEKERVLEQLKEKIQFMGEKLQNFQDLSHVGDIRQKGLLAGLELVKEPISKEPYPLEEQIGIKVIVETRKRGVILRPLGNVIVLMPPLSITLPELQKMLSITYEAIAKVTEKA